jgi:hypothetical protein
MFSLLILGASLASAALCAVLQIAMIADVNRKLGARSPLRDLRAVSSILQEHQRLFPASRSRLAFIISSFLLIASAIAFVLVLKFGH